MPSGSERPERRARRPARGETVVHGTRWNTVHDGYFSDPAVAAPLVRRVLAVARRLKPDRIVDLGGGTGFLLSQMAAAGIGRTASLINLDESSAQLAAAPARLARVLGSVDSFPRSGIGPADARCLFVMRSVLHYFGRRGLHRVLSHLRAQARSGEFFVHQTASFVRQRDADCLNRIYTAMGTTKWYPTVAFLRQALRRAGWKVLAVHPAPALRLKSGDLAERYHLDRTAIDRIRMRISCGPRPPANVCRPTADGFCAFLHYHVFICAPRSDRASGRRRERVA